MKLHRATTLAACILIVIIANSHAGIQKLQLTGKQLPDGAYEAIVVASSDNNAAVSGTKTHIDLSGYIIPLTQPAFPPDKGYNPAFIVIITLIFAVLYIQEKMRRKDAGEY